MRSECEGAGSGVGQVLRIMSCEKSHPAAGPLVNVVSTDAK